MNLEQISSDYLFRLGVSEHFDYRFIPCELCESEKFEILRTEIGFGQGRYGNLPIQVCCECGYIMQNPRFEKNFYRDFYRKYYRKFIKGKTTPSQDFIEDQILRGQTLLSSSRHLFPKTGGLLDVGCSAGGMLLPFKEIGWDVYGMDPDTDYVRHGQEVLKLNIDYMDGEDINLGQRKFDLIIIMGSLEHVYDPNLILSKCRESCTSDSVLLMEGRFWPLGHSRDYFNHNHHRYLRKDSMELLMLKHGWTPFYTTDEMICGNTRQGNGYVFGRVTDSKLSNEEIVSEAKKRDALDVDFILNEFDEIDQKF